MLPPASISALCLGLSCDFFLISPRLLPSASPSPPFVGLSRDFLLIGPRILPSASPSPPFVGLSYDLLLIDPRSPLLPPILPSFVGLSLNYLIYAPLTTLNAYYCTPTADIYSSATASPEFEIVIIISPSSSVRYIVLSAASSLPSVLA